MDFFSLIDEPVVIGNFDIIIETEKPRPQPTEDAQRLEEENQAEVETDGAVDKFESTVRRRARKRKEVGDEDMHAKPTNDEPRLVRM